MPEEVLPFKISAKDRPAFLKWVLKRDKDLGDAILAWVIASWWVALFDAANTRIKVEQENI